MEKDPATRYLYIGSLLWLVCLIPWAIDVTAHFHGTKHQLAIGLTVAILILGCIVLAFGISKIFRSQ